MFYKCSDPKTSTSDWFALNTDAIPQALIKVMDEDGDLLLEEILPDLPELDENDLVGTVTEDERLEAGAGREVVIYDLPDRDGYAEGHEGDADFAADKIEIEAHNKAAREFAERHEGEDLLPMWGTMWHVEDHPELREACFEVGLRLYEHAEINGILIGADSAGHSFYGAYWIPLRARLALRQKSGSGPFTFEGPLAGKANARRRAAFGKMLRAEAAKEGEARRLESVVEAAKAA